MGTYLNRTPSSASNRKTWTWSGWVKRGNINLNIMFLSAGSSSGQGVYLTSGNQLQLTKSGVGNYGSTALLRDVAAWYHFVVAVDTTQTGMSNIAKFYINGVQQTASGTTIYSTDEDTEINNNTAHYISRWSKSAQYYHDGYLAEVNFIDGQALTPTSFGETDSTTGIWKPKTFSGTYGTNGFKLEFKNAGALGTDTSGQSNTWTVNNAGTGAQVVDTPSNNFAIINPSAITNADSVLTLGGTVHTVKNGNAWIGAYTTLGATKGKWYSEVKVIDVENTSFGVIQSGGDTVANINNDNTGYIGKYADGWGWWGNGSSAQTVNNNNNVNYGTAVSVNDIYMIAVDITGGKIWMGKNGTWFNGPGTSYAGNPANGNYPGFTGITFTDFVHFASGNEAASGDNAAVSWNFGNASFSISSNSGNGYADANNFGKFQYTVPSGYYALCTKNVNSYG